MLALGPIGFAAPYVLAGLLALPVIWWLLRLTPPRPRRLKFPPVRLLKGLETSEQTPSHSPWWLTLLRILLVTLIILALARPVLFPDQEVLPGRGPVVVVLDNGWASANDWERRKRHAKAVLARAGEDNRVVYLVPTAPETGFVSIAATTSSRALQKLDSLKPQPFAPARMAVLRALQRQFANRQDAADAVTKTRANNNKAPLFYWISDAVDHGRAAAFLKALRRLASDSAHLIVVQAASTGNSLKAGEQHHGPGPVGLFATVDKAGQLEAHLRRADTARALAGQVYAFNSKGQRLGEVRFSFKPGERETKVRFTLPLELRNEISRLEIAGQRSAAAVHLLDHRARWKRVGLISGEARESAQPLLSPSYYIRKALDPFTEVTIPGKSNLSLAVKELLEAKMSVIILADIGRISGAPFAALSQWVERGGMLVRFAGARLEKGGDQLLPVPLRRGERSLGGALSWSEPQPLSPFEEDSPFHGLKVPKDVAVKRQVLADPAALGASHAEVWARLKDGTPLVSALRRGKGWLVLFHITANSDWSSVPMSGLFVEMLRRLVDMAGGSAAMVSGANVAETADAAKRIKLHKPRTTPRMLRPYQQLNGFGELSPPSAQALAIRADALTKTKPGPSHPPGYYGPPDSVRAFNLITAKTKLAGFSAKGYGVRVKYFTASGSANLQPWLLLAAFFLLLADSLLTLIMSAKLEHLWRPRLAAAGGGRAVFYGMLAGAGLAIGGVLPHSLPVQAQIVQAQTMEAVNAGRAEQSPAQQAAADRFALKAATRTRLAYVITGDPEIDRISYRGLVGLSRILTARTAFEPGEPIGVHLDRDELAFFPLLYWPVRVDGPEPSAATLARVDAYMKNGGMILFDSRDQQQVLGPGFKPPGQRALQKILRRLDLPRLEPVPDRHVVSRSFYLLKDFPGRWKGGTLWVEARPDEQARKYQQRDQSDGVSAILITSNDMAGAWAVDENGAPLLAVVPGGHVQREYAYRAGVNIVMYALTGNYKADQVHLPALLERLGQ